MSKDIPAKVVRGVYSRLAKGGEGCCASCVPCCGSAHLPTDISGKTGYIDADLGSVPEGSNLGLGCGNPVAAASLKEGEVVLDLGSGAGPDCLLAAQDVGTGGKVIGVDMTAEMVERARECKERRV